MWSAELGCHGSTVLTRIFKGVKMPAWDDVQGYDPDAGGTFTGMGKI